MTLAGFIVAGGFSSLISSAVGDIILIDSAKCGFILWPNETATTGRVLQLHSERLSNAANYAQQCYTTNSSGILGCSRFVKDRLSWEEDTNAACPFVEDVCKTKDSNIRLDTGVININQALGFNRPGNEGTAFRRVLSCAPLVTEGYTSLENTANETIVRYHHGHWESNSSDNRLAHNYSYRIDNLDSQNSRHRDLDAAVGLNFKLVSIPAVTVYGQVYYNAKYTFVPVPDLQRPDGDVVIVYLSPDGVVFDQPMQDDWYRVQSPGDGPFELPTFQDSKDYWVMDEPATPLGCVMQHQYCNLALPEGSDCGPLASFFDAALYAEPLFNSSYNELDRLSWIYNLHAYGAPVHIYELLNHLGAASLSSQSQLINGRQYTSQPTTQWQSDVRHWFATLAAALQAAYIDVALGPDDVELNKFWNASADDLEQSFCDSQKARSSQYASFSVFGLYFTYVTGGLIILISVSIEPILECLHKRRGWQSYQQLEWTTNQQLQLLRLAYEESGYGKWSKCTDFVPLTEKDEKLCPFDISQLDHPSIMRVVTNSVPQISSVIEAPHDIDGPTSASASPSTSLSTMNDEASSASIGGRTVADGGSPAQTINLKRDRVQSEHPLQISDMASEIPDGDPISISIHDQPIESLSDIELTSCQENVGESCRT
ncbi:hypothetical protein G7054_g522 [Neopestalotiopsis clavispora]|nr:hypothetical protein G7054_g522 [Neopestalotiopsis clavispora]